MKVLNYGIRRLLKPNFFFIFPRQIKVCVVDICTNCFQESEDHCISFTDIYIYIFFFIFFFNRFIDDLDGSCS